MLVINFTNHIIFSFTESTDSVLRFTSLLYRIGNFELATLLSYVFIHTIILRYKHMFLTNVCVVFLESLLVDSVRLVWKIEIIIQAVKHNNYVTQFAMTVHFYKNQLFTDN